MSIRLFIHFYTRLLDRMVDNGQLDEVENSRVCYILSK